MVPFRAGLANPACARRCACRFFLMAPSDGVAGILCSHPLATADRLGSLRGFIDSLAGLASASADSKSIARPRCARCFESFRRNTFQPLSSVHAKLPGTRSSRALEPGPALLRLLALCILTLAPPCTIICYQNLCDWPGQPNLGHGRTLMQGVAPQTCDQVTCPLLGGEAGGRSPGFVSVMVGCGLRCDNILCVP